MQYLGTLDVNKSQITGYSLERENNIRAVLVSIVTLIIVHCTYFESSEKCLLAQLM